MPIFIVTPQVYYIARCMFARTDLDFPKQSEAKRSSTLIKSSTKEASDIMRMQADSRLSAIYREDKVSATTRPEARDAQIIFSDSGDRWIFDHLESPNTSPARSYISN